MRDKICEFEERAWDSFCESHPNMCVGGGDLRNTVACDNWLGLCMFLRATVDLY